MRHTERTPPRWLFPASGLLVLACAVILIVQSAEAGRIALLVVGSVGAALQVAGLVVMAVQAQRGRR